MTEFLALLKKDWLSELRQGQTIFLLLSLCLLFCILSACGITVAGLPRGQIIRIFPFVYWLIFFSAASVCIGVTSESDLRERGIEGLLLAGAKPSLIFLSKTLVNNVILLFSQIVIILALVIFVNVPFRVATSPIFLATNLLVTLVFASLVTLLSGLTIRSTLGVIATPLFIIPLSFPIFFAALELTTEVTLGISPSWASPWFSLLLGLNFIYTALGLLLYGPLIGRTSRP